MQLFEFDKTNTFCITLETSNRWATMEARLAHAGVDATKWPASTPNDITDAFHEGLNGGQKGCAQSHINIYKHILKEGLDYALILEDDACFDRDWKAKLDAFSFQNKDTEWDAIFLNASEPIDPPFTWCKCKEQYLTAGYIISRRGVDKIMRDFGGRFCSSDWMTSRLQLHGHSYCYFPWLIIQEGNDSSIGQQFEADHAKVVRCLYSIQYSLENYITDAVDQ